ncbi:hypothetical protein CHS0354_000746 [Potamilus streckersoni]|uniref:Type V CRISPR-associated protein Cpf1 n=1 Tax=Potamilus streckersoni TaxID=2493646 RepID=A0AAE0T876_9BIVA|nr:hypothetical protein CHS0354_000746 [Potamilus streckersoni]
MKTIKDFVGIFPVSKTLRFELQPIGETEKNIKEKGLLDKDKDRSEDYKEVKKIADNYHKKFISESLSNLSLSDLGAYYESYKIQKKDAVQKEKFKKIQNKLREEIAKAFKKKDSFKRLFAKELIKEDLLAFVSEEKDKNLVLKFKDFTTYFIGFNKNRENMYSSDEKATAIAYRLIHQNLPKFIDNMHVFEKVSATAVADNFIQIYSDLKAYLNVNSINELFKLNYYSSLLTQEQIDVYNTVIGGKALEDGTKIKGLNEYINLYNQQQTEKAKRLPKLKPLFKQILSDRNAISWLAEEFKRDDHNAVLKSIEKFYQDVNGHCLNKEVKGEHSLKQLLESISDYDLNGLYVRNDIGLTEVSKKFLGHRKVIQTAIEKKHEIEKPREKETEEEYQEKKTKYFNSFDSFSIAFINECLDLMESEKGKNVADYFKHLGKQGDDASTNHFNQIKTAYASVQELLNTPYSDKKPLPQNKAEVEKIKVFLDSIKSLQWFVKPLLGKGDEAGKDERFYGEFTELWKRLHKTSYKEDKKKLIEKINEYIEEKLSDTKLKEKINEEIDKSSDSITPNEYISMIKQHSEDELNKLLKYEKFNHAQDELMKKIRKVFDDRYRCKFSSDTKLKENYLSLNDLMDDIEKLSKTKIFEYYKICDKEMQQCLERKEEPIYLFKITNKDLSYSDGFSKGKRKSRGTENLHTMYFKALMKGNQNVFDIGTGQVFFREKSLEYTDDVFKKGHHFEELKSKFNYPIISNKRYAMDKFQFHLSIIQNYQAPKSPNSKEFNLKVNQFIKSNADNMHIIGIDRGERHLLYLSLIDSKGNLKEQFSLNEIINHYKGKEYKTNYHTRLDEKEGDRDEARKNWKTIEGIADLKEGYLSQVIHKITEMMIEYNAIVVLEDLNFGFTRSRQKIEKQVYKKFEKMLINKLNYLVDKKKAATELGGVLQAYQLTSKFVKFETLGKQSGFLFYIPAWNTSKIDPVTGFANLFDTRYENASKAKTFFSKFKSIKFNKSKGYFEFEVDNYTKFNPKAESTRQEWTICTQGERIKTFRNPEKNNEWDNEVVKLTDKFKNLFDSNNITFDDEICIKERIAKSDSGKAFFEPFLHLFKLTLQMRNSKTGTDIDYLISPIANEKGVFFDSRQEAEKNKPTLPKDADANGAYNIARKGLLIIDKIKKAEDLKKLDLTINNKEWLDFARKTKN